MFEANNFRVRVDGLRKWPSVAICSVIIWSKDESASFPQKMTKNFKLYKYKIIIKVVLWNKPNCFVGLDISSPELQNGACYPKFVLTNAQPSPKPIANIQMINISFL